jgi:hypothetical protein
MNVLYVIETHDPADNTWYLEDPDNEVFEAKDEALDAFTDLRAENPDFQIRLVEFVPRFVLKVENEKLAAAKS